jgi:transcriptional regulator with XRE-family HTH domain
MAPGDLVAEARRGAGITQTELARRLGTTQSAIARLERPGSNPTVAQLDRAIAGAGRRLELTVVSPSGNVDESLIVEQLKLTPAERLRAFEAAYADAREIALAGARARGELA